MKRKVIGSMILAGLGFASNQAMAVAAVPCSDPALVTAVGVLQQKAASVVPVGSTPNGGLGFPMWVTIVDNTGVVCSVVNSAGASDVEGFSGEAWLGSRVISAQKANTANAFSHDAFPLSTANLFSAVQPWGSLYGLQHSNPVDATIAYDGDASTWGSGTTDPLVNNRIGGVNIFGGGLALYVDDNGNAAGGIRKVGAIGVSGDTSCTDHVVAWKIRNQLGLDHVPAGVANKGKDDAMIQDIVGSNGNFRSKSGFGHATCLNNPTDANDGGAIEGNKKH
ncbi:heme-binding protein [Methylomicrobium lacus]|uniref:GlcG/HbpS family heme-binding protein n=1 Tax=Methylomicrobium lacus TaxID=136992 RepID=UPI0035A9427C